MAGALFVLCTPRVERMRFQTCKSKPAWQPLTEEGPGRLLRLSHDWLQAARHLLAWATMLGPALTWLHVLEASTTTQAQSCSKATGSLQEGRSMRPRHPSRPAAIKSSGPAQCSRYLSVSPRTCWAELHRGSSPTYGQAVGPLKL